LLAAALVPPVWVAVAFGNASDVVMLGAVAFSSEGRALATVSYPQSPRPHVELRVWDLMTGRERRSERRVVPNPLLTVADGGERLGPPPRHAARQLSRRVCCPERPLTDGRIGLNCLAALSFDGNPLATARHQADQDHDTRVQLWDVATGRLIKTLDDGKLVDMLAFSPDGHILAGARGRLAAWDVGSGGVLGWPKAASLCVAPLTFAPDGSALVVQGDGGKLTLLDA